MVSIASKIYDQSKEMFENAQTIQDVINLSHNTKVDTNVEAGPIELLDQILRNVKPDVFLPMNPNDKEKKICDEDPQIWWVVSRRPVCVGWINGNCGNIEITKTKIYNKCNFCHDISPYITVETVTTKTLINKMKNKVKKLRKNGMKNNKTHYTNPFTGVTSPCNYNKIKTNRLKTIKGKSQVVCEINKTRKEPETSNNSATSPFSTVTGQSWASICELENEEDRLNEFENIL